MLRILFLHVVLCFSIALFAQKKKENTQPSRKFGKVTAEELQTKFYSIDSNANAVVLYDFGRSEIVGNSKNWFSLEYTHYRVVHILKKAGYDMGDIEIPLYIDGIDEERVNSVKAVTYNLENGQVVETKLEKSGVFTDKLDKNHILKKFTLPNIKEGSIIEYEFKTTSDFLFNLEPWSFQGSAPRLWSEYQLTVPDFMGYVFLTQGYHPLHINDKTSGIKVFTVLDANSTSASQSGSFTSPVSDHRWVMKDVPELKEERFTSTLSNHVSRIEFQLAEYRPPLTYRQIMHTWPQATKELMESEHFGKVLSANNSWMVDDLKPVLANASTKLEKARNIFAFVRDNFVCTDYSALYAEQSLRNVMKNKKGSVSEINLLLTALLRHVGFTASPVMLSTREHGYTYELYPVIGRFNYVVSQLAIDDQVYYLDASRPRIGFGKIPFQCYNGWARIINETALGLDLSSDSLQERKVSSLVLIDDQGKWQGKFTQQPGYYESFEMRSKIKEQGEEALFKNLQKSYGSDAKTVSHKIDSLNDYDEPIQLEYQFTLSPDGQDLLYINPLFGEAQKENPFKSAERLYPVEMPFTIDESYLATIFVPNGYLVEELPKPIKVKLNDRDEGLFEYIIQQTGDIISMRSRVKLSRAYYAPEEYEVLREFFNLIVKKQSEQIVFKKKK